MHGGGGGGGGGGELKPPKAHFGELKSSGDGNKRLGIREQNCSVSIRFITE